MRLFPLIVMVALLSACSTPLEHESLIGTYFRIPTVDDEPTGRLDLLSDGRYEYLSVLPQTRDAATGAPFSVEDSGSWVLERGYVVLKSESGGSRRMKVLFALPRLTLEWSRHINFAKEVPNKTPLPTSTSVTPRAGARVAPAALVAGL